MSKKLLVVFGATGNQGGSIAEVVLDSPELSKQYSVRAITRSSSNPKVHALQAKGAEIVEADLGNPSSLKAALTGAHTVFAITTTQYGQDTRQIETQQAKALCEEAIAQKVEYIIWSSLSHPVKITDGKLSHIDFFDVKAEVEDYIRSLPIKSAFFAPGSFMQNFHDHMKPRPSPANDGTYVIGDLLYPDSVIPLIDITDTGKWVAAILAEPEKYEGKQFCAADRLYTMTEIAEIISQFTGTTVKYQNIPDDVFKGFLSKGYFEMHLLMRDYGYYGKNMKENVQWAKDQARGHLTTFEEWLKKEQYSLE
ncbi:NAD(P)-binding protein [Lophiostoma macrostomum CBS 122681]|uniref:NAD(P)-binding protein n=1 Tax=Lophiostoma macrostomum CBS 122681 TaxID=1314788 RepID=A0A6A6TSV1_9PLEO|nr:NAD(P)-binding protein [Lophiostoma macrostomum CBS 122681]